MGNDIEITVRVGNQSAAGITSVNQSLRGLRSNARDAGQALTTLAARSAAAALAMRGLQSQANDTSRALRDLRARATAAAASLGDMRDVNAQVNTSLRAMTTRAGSADGRLGDLDDRVRTLRGGMDDLGGAISGVNDGLGDMRGGLGNARGALGGLSEGAKEASGSLGGGGGLKGQLIGAGVALGTLVLPSIGALSPMLFGLVGVGGAAALAFKDMKEEAKKLKPEFEAMQKVASKAVMPGVKDAAKDLRVAMKDLNPVIRVGGEAFGQFAQDAAAFAKSPAFQGALLKNVQMGSAFFRDFSRSILGFTQAFMDFGTKSLPTLDAFTKGLGGLLGDGGKGLGGMFQGLERGIGGSAEFLNGFFGLLNKSLPALGRFAGEMANAFGPLLGAVFDLAGDQVAGFLDSFGSMARLAKPVVDELTFGVRAFHEVSRIVSGTLIGLGSAIVGAFAPSFSGITEARGLMERLHGVIVENKGQILELGRFFSGAMIGMVEAGVTSLPVLIGAWRAVSEGILAAIDAIVSGAAAAFGDLPVIGEQFKDANAAFDTFKDGYLGGLEAAQKKTREFANEAVPRLKENSLKLDISNYDEQIKVARSQLKAVPAEKRSKLTAHISELIARKKEAEGKLKEFAAKRATARLGANKSGFDRVLAMVRAARIPAKSVPVRANSTSFRAAIQGIVGRVLGTAYVNVSSRGVGRIARRAEGGPIEGGSGTRDDVPILAMGGEFVVNKASTRKHRALIEAINEDKLPQFAKGGLVSKTERDARAGAAGALGVSPYGRVAGYTGTSFGKELGASSSVNDLVNSLNKWRGIIKAATSGMTEKGLLTQLAKAGAQLLRYERQQAKVNAALDKAREKLSSLRDAAGQLRDQVAGGITGAANITQTAQGGGPVSAGSIVGDLRRDRDRATALEGALKQLRGKGLNAESLSEIAQAGIEGGGLETASALLGASKSDIKEINVLEKQLKASAAESGKITAGAMYDSGIKAAEGLVKGLEKQRRSLERLMESIAKALERSLRKAFGLGGKASGGIIGAASGGARGGMTWVGEQGPEAVRLPYGSRVYPAGQSRQMAGGGAPIIVHQTITLDGKVLARQIFDPLRGEISRRGGNVQTSLGR